MKKLFKIFAVLFLLAFCGVAVFLSTFDINDYKARIEYLASTALDEPVKVNGTSSLSFANWQPSLALHDVTAGDKHADKLEVTVPLKRPKEGEPLGLFAVVGGFSMDGRRLGDYETPVFLTDDGFDAPEIKGRFGDADVKGRFNYLGDRMHAEMKAAGLDYKDIFGSIEGSDVTADFLADARGANAKALTRGMNGHFTLIGGSGTMSGRALDFWGADLLSLALFSHDKATKVNCIVADFKIVNGVFVARKVMIDTDRVAVTGTGSIDIAHETVDMRFTPKPKEKALVNLATPVIARGKFGKVEVLPDPAGLARTVGGLVLSAVNPAMAVVPYVLQDTAAKDVCIKYLQERE